MPLPKNIIELFRSAKCRTTITTVDAEGTAYTALFIISATPDGSMMIAASMGAKETPKRLKHMKQAGKQAVIVGFIVDYDKKLLESYCVWCEVGDEVTSGPIFEKTTSEWKEKLSEKWPELLEKRPITAVWTLRPVKYKIQAGPDHGKIVTL